MCAFNRKNAVVTPQPGGIGSTETSMANFEEILQAVLSTAQDALRVTLTPDSTNTASLIANTAQFVRGSQYPATNSVPKSLVATASVTFAQTVTIWAQRAGRVANTSAVYIDSIGGNQQQQIKLNPGASITFTAPPGHVLDLSTIFVGSVTDGDGVFFLGML